jgi:hypothetical protein
VAQSAGLSRIPITRPRRWGRVFIAGLLLGFDIFALPIWGIWAVASLRGSGGVMTLNDVPVPSGYFLLFGPLAVASLVAVWLISMLRAYPIVLGIAVAWLAHALAGFVVGAFNAGAVIERALIVGLLVSGRMAFRS